MISQRNEQNKGTRTETPTLTKHRIPMTDSKTAFMGTISNVPLAAARVLISASNAAVVTGWDFTSGTVSLTAQGLEADMIQGGGQWRVVGKRVSSRIVGNGAHAWPTCG